MNTTEKDKLLKEQIDLIYKLNIDVNQVSQTLSSSTDASSYQYNVIIEPCKNRSRTDTLTTMVISGASYRSS